MSGRRTLREALAAALALSALLLPCASTLAGEAPAPPAAGMAQPGGIFIPDEDEIRRYLAVLPLLLRATDMAASRPSGTGAAAPRGLPKEAMARLAGKAGFASLERFVRTHAAVLAAYACLQAEGLRDDLARQSRHSPEAMAGPWRDRRRDLNDKIEALRREVAPETLDRVRPHLPALARILDQDDMKPVGR